MSGTTNTLLEISDYLHKRNPDGANEIINMLELKYLREIEDLFESKEYKIQTLEVIKSHFDHIRSLPKSIYPVRRKVIVAQGTFIQRDVYQLFKRARLECRSFAGSQFMRINKNADPTKITCVNI